MLFVRSFSVGFAAAALLMGTALAQTKPPAQRAAQPQTTAQPQATAPAPAPAPVSSEPETTTASYGAWVLRCQRRPEAGAEGRFCEVDQSIVPQGQQNPIAQIGIGRPSPKEDLRITAVLPANVTFPSTPKISSGEKDVGVELVWRRCIQGGCVADNVVKDDMLRNWRGETAEEAGHLVFVEANGRTVNIQFSFRGLAQAMDAFSKEK